MSTQFKNFHLKYCSETFKQTCEPSSQKLFIFWINVTTNDYVDKYIHEVQLRQGLGFANQVSDVYQSYSQEKTYMHPKSGIDDKEQP